MGEARHPLQQHSPGVSGLSHCHSSLSIYESSAQNALEASIRALNLKRHLPPAPFLHLLLGLHPVQPDQPRDDFSPAFEIPVRDCVHALDQLREEGVQGVLGGHAELQRVEEGDEVLSGEEDLGVGGRLRTGRVAGGGGRGRALLPVRVVEGRVG